MNLLDTVAAISTPYGKGGVAMIRISGADAVAVAQRVFFPKSGKSLSDVEHSRAVYGEIFMPDDDKKENRIDDGIAVVFRAPHSFTGEDTVEISCHGGVLVTQKVLSAVLCAGARSAEAGEFTRRAYISGKIKLTEAESLGALLDAKNDSQLALASNGMRGRLSSKIGELYSGLLSVMSGIYAVIDFPDEDLSDMSREEIYEVLVGVKKDLDALISTYKTGSAVAQGIPTVICGRTNAGKSSVYNRILGYDAAIVTDIEGTTRDVLRESASMGKVTLLLCDTAGIRNTGDKVESIGIERSLREMSGAGLLLAVFDGAREPDEEDIEFAKRVLDQNACSIALINKSDISTGEAFDKLCNGFSRVIHISAENGEGFDRLSEAVEELFIDESIDISNDAVVTEARQYASLKNASELLYRTLCDMADGISLDACCVGIECVMSALGELDGREIGEEIVAEIFSKFCVGK